MKSNHHLWRNRTIPPGPPVSLCLVCVCCVAFSMVHRSYPLSVPDLKSSLRTAPATHACTHTRTHMDTHTQYFWWMERTMEKRHTEETERKRTLRGYTGNRRTRGVKNTMNPSAQWRLLSRLRNDGLVFRDWFVIGWFNNTNPQTRGGGWGDLSIPPHKLRQQFLTEMVYMHDYLRSYIPKGWDG